jgi:hypothetical protein
MKIEKRRKEGRKEGRKERRKEGRRREEERGREEGRNVIMLSDISQSEKDKYCMFPLIYRI